MKKRLILTIIIAGMYFFIFPPADTYAQTVPDNINIRTFDREVSLKMPAATELYEIKVAAGHFYMFTVGARGFGTEEWKKEQCRSLSGNDLSLLFILPDRRQYFVVDVRQSEGVESFVFGANANERMNVAVITDAPRCSGFRLELTTSDPSVTGIPAGTAGTREELTQGLQQGGVQKIAPPGPNQLAAGVLRELSSDLQMLEQWRSKLNNLNEYYRKPYGWIEQFSKKYHEFVYSLHEADFGLRQTEKDKAALFKKVQDAYGGLRLEFTATDSELFEYFRLLDLNRTLGVYRQSINNWGGDAGRIREMLAELDSLQSFYNQSAPPAIARIDPLIPKDKLLGDPALINDSIGPVYNQLYHRLNRIKGEGLQAGINWNCQFYKLKGVIELPFCSFPAN